MEQDTTMRMVVYKPLSVVQPDEFSAEGVAVAPMVQVTRRYSCRSLAWKSTTSTCSCIGVAILGHQGDQALHDLGRSSEDNGSH
jgi:hypothetical protein